jgi:hypothetical protein
LRGAIISDAVTRFAAASRHALMPQDDTALTAGIAKPRSFA